MRVIIARALFQSVALCPPLCASTGDVDRMLESVRGFLDMDRIRNQTMSEYLLKT